MSQSKEEGRGWVVFIVALIIVTIWIILGILARDIFPEIEQAGQFGDMFGFSNSLFSGLALAGVVIAIWFQREEIKVQREDLKLQREELQLTRDEMKEQTKQFEAQRDEMAAQVKFMQEQSTTMVNQRFQDSFFQMLKHHTEMVNSMPKFVNGVVKQKNVLGGVVEVYRRDHNDSRPGHVPTVVFADMIVKNKSQIYPYLFRLETMLKYIDESELDDKASFADVLRGGMSDEETIFLNMYGQEESHGFGRLMPLVKKYKLLIPLDKLRYDQFGEELEKKTGGAIKYYSSNRTQK